MKKWKERPDLKFPQLKPAAVDYAYLQKPIVVNWHDVKGVEYFPGAGGITKFLITEYTPAVRVHSVAYFSADPGKGSSWHTHPEETGEEELMHIISGKGTIYYKQNKKEYAIPVRKGDGIFSGHLTHCVKNTGTEPLEILVWHAPLPHSTIIYGELRDLGRGYVDYSHLKPPMVVHAEDVERKPVGMGSEVRRFFSPQDGLKHMSSLINWLEKPGCGTSWHSHTAETGQEDIYVILQGKGVNPYLYDGKVYTIDFEEGDAVFCGHLTNYTVNTGDKEVVMSCALAPLGSIGLHHEVHPELLYPLESL